MSQVLYRKYRPQSFKDVIAQDSIVKILKESVMSDSLSHAYLFCGPRGCGKTSMARIMAKAVNCLNFNESGDICNSCTNCMSIDSGSMDIVEMDAASNRGIEEIKILKDSVNFVPSILKRKVYIIDEAHMLTREAFNALLKTLEEPPSHVIFILATTEVNKLPQTILSRVTRFDFKLGSEQEIISKLDFISRNEGVELSMNSLKVIFDFSGGSFRDSESILSKILLSVEDNKISDQNVLSLLGITDEGKLRVFLDLLSKKDLNGCIKFINQIDMEGINLSIFLDQFLKYLTSQIVKEENIVFYKNYVDIANLAIKIKGSIRDFSVKSSVAIISLIDFCNTNQSLNSISIPPKQEPTKDFLISKDQKEEVIIKEVPVAASVKVEFVNHTVSPDQKTYLLQLSQKSQSILPRFSGIINTSKIELNIESATIKVLSPYKFNIAYLSKKEARDLFLGVAKELFGKEFAISYVISSIPQEEKSNTIEEQTSAKIVKETIKKEDLPNLDNTSLVEEIF